MLLVCSIKRGLLEYIWVILGEKQNSHKRYGVYETRVKRDLCPLVVNFVNWLIVTRKTHADSLFVSFQAHIRIISDYVFVSTVHIKKK